MCPAYIHNNIQYNCSHNRNRKLGIVWEGWEQITSIQHRTISNNIEKVHIINDGGGEGGRGNPPKVKHRRDLIATPKFRLIVTTPANPKQKPNSNFLSAPHTAPHGSWLMG